MITFPEPMHAPERLHEPFTDPDWLYEIKWDGYRCLAGVESGQVELRTKRGADCTGWFPEVAHALATIPGGPHIIDGEVCVLDDLGRADFNCLQERARRRRWYPGCHQVTLMAFDLLVHHGDNISGLALVERKALLQQLIVHVPRQAVLYVGDLPADAGLFRLVVHGLKLEGVVAKRRASTYQPGVRSPDWMKIKRDGWQEGRAWRNR